VCLVLFAVTTGATDSATTSSQVYVDNGSEQTMDADEFENAPFLPTEAEEGHDEIEGADASDEEAMAEDENQDEQDELEGNGEFSLLESDAQVDADKDKKKKKRARVVRAPRPIKAKPFKFHSERIEAKTSKFEDPEMAKLNLALAAVKEDILSTNKQITDERKWVIAVAKILASYNDKMKRVEAHIIALRKEMKALYRKKKQIENLKLQKALEAKLREARDELTTLTNSLKHVAVKQGELNRSGAALRNTIAGIQAQLAKLRGQQIRPRAARKCGKGKRYSKKAKRCVARKGRKSRKARLAGLRRVARKL